MLVQENLTGLGVIEQWGTSCSQLGGNKEERGEKKGSMDEEKIRKESQKSWMRGHGMAQNDHFSTLPPALPLLPTSQSRATSTPSVMAAAFSKRFPSPKKNFIASDRRPYNYNAAPTLSSALLYERTTEGRREGGPLRPAMSEMRVDRKGKGGGGTSRIPRANVRVIVWVFASFFGSS